MIQKPDPLLVKVRDTCKRYRLFRKGETVVVAVSGGPDSVFLLRALNDLREALGLKLVVAHVDHQLRGRASAGDARFVRDLARRLGVPCVLKSVAVKTLAQRQKRSLEEMAREVRYGFFRRVMAKYQAHKIATGHTRDDQAETMLMRMLRGASRTGLAGIRPRHDGVVVRPLLEVTKPEILGYLQTHRIRFRIDQSNRSVVFLRNKVRHQLLPYLEKNFNPHIRQVLANETRLLQEEDVFLAALTDEALAKTVTYMTKNKIVLEKSVLLNYTDCLKRRILVSSLNMVSGSAAGINAQQVESVLSLLPDTANTRVDLPGRMAVEITLQKVIIRAKPVSTHGQVLAVPGVTVLRDSVSIAARIVPRAGIGYKNNPAHVGMFDADLLDGPLVVRTRRPGDRMQPLGMTGTKKVKDLLMDLKLPRLERDEVPLVTHRGSIIWAAGVRMGDRYKVINTTKNILILTYNQAGTIAHE
jgi:tRNA(Ile)-lysidine synthase